MRAKEQCRTVHEGQVGCCERDNAAGGRFRRYGTLSFLDWDLVSAFNTAQHPAAQWWTAVFSPGGCSSTTVCWPKCAA